MPKAGEVASELRRLADALDREPETNVQQPLVSFYCGTQKEIFMHLAKIFPRPFFKVHSSRELTLEHGNKYSGKGALEGPVWFRAQIERSAVCRLLKPAQEAVYDCEPILSQEEEDSLVEV